MWRMMIMITEYKDLNGCRTFTRGAILNVHLQRLSWLGLDMNWDITWSPVLASLAPHLRLLLQRLALSSSPDCLAHLSLTLCLFVCLIRFIGVKPLPWSSTPVEFYFYFILYFHEFSWSLIIWKLYLTLSELSAVCLLNFRYHLGPLSYRGALHSE